LVTAEGRGHERAVRERDAVLRGRREQTLKEGDRGVEDDQALATSLGADVDLVVVDKLGPDTPNVGRATLIEVDRAQIRPELVRLDLISKSVLWTLKYKLVIPRPEGCAQSCKACS
jgi:hypothetical protein